MTTIRDVAAKANVSVATVSAVINDKPGVSATVRKRVRAVIEDLDYKPNGLARALFSKQSACVAFLVPSISNPGYARVLRSAEHVCQERGYSIYVGQTNGNRDVALKHQERLIELRVAGVLHALTWDVAWEEYAATFLRHNIPVVGTGGSRVSNSIDCFLVDPAEAGYMAGRYLRDLGHTRVAFLGPTHSHTAAQRLAGVRNAFAENDLPLDDGLVRFCDGYDFDSAYRATRELVAHSYPFTALVVFNDLMATGAVAALVEQGLSVPHNVSIMTFGSFYASVFNPKLTSIGEPEDEFGRLATTRLLDRIEKKHQEKPDVTRLKPSLELRQSTIALSAVGTVR